MDSGPVGEQIGVILRFEEPTGLEVVDVRRLIARRIAAVPRLRQRLVGVPFGCGRPIWVDHNAFDIADHVGSVRCPEPGDDRALMDAAVALVAAPLPRSAPLWSATLVTGLSRGGAALVVVLHHVLADGVGGLGVLAGLVDQAPSPPEVAFPRPRPSVLLLAVDAMCDKWRGVRRGIETLRLLRISTAASGGLRPAPAARCSLIHRTGTRVRLDVVSADHAALRSAAHSHGATVNDALLVAVSGALHRVLLDRGESLDSFAIAIPVSIRAADSPAFGNMVSPSLVSVPAVGLPADRLRRVHCEMSARKATAPPPIALLGWLFRRLAALGGYRWYMGHQRRFHTLVSYVHGPVEQVDFGGYPIAAAIPVAVGGMGNVTVYFEVLSYAGTLTVTVISDPDHFPDPQNLTAALRDELGLVASSTTSSTPASKRADTSSRQAPG
jgi:diacylglycerol O-acyltransferase / wax synthase